MFSLFDQDVQQKLKASPAITTTTSGATIPYPFPSPADWRDHWIYFLLVDRFDNPAAPPTPNNYPCYQYQGGNLAGIRQRLAYLKSLGVGAIWISPVLMNPQWFKDYWGGYGMQNFLRIEPRFCSDPVRALADPAYAEAEFRSLVDEAHALGMYVILDIVLNHAGDVFGYKGFGNTAPYANHEYEIAWRDENGNMQNNWTAIEHVSTLTHDQGIWPVELQKNAYFRRQGTSNDNGDFDRMKEFVTDYKNPLNGNHDVRKYLILAYQYLIAALDIDGYRIDTLMYVEPEFARIFGNSMREYALSIGKKNFFTFGEVWKDDDESGIAEFIGRNTSKDGDLVGVDAALDFPLRKRLHAVAKAQISPAILADHMDKRRELLRQIVSSHGDASRYYVTFLDNHDLADRFHNKDYPAQTTIALSCLMTLQGIPCIYYGTERGLENFRNSCRDRENSREALWGQQNAFDINTNEFQLIRDLSGLRAKEPAIRYGRQYFRMCSGDGLHFGYSPFAGGILAFSRILNEQEILVVANTNPVQTTTIFIQVDFNLHVEGSNWEVIFPAGQDGVAKTTTVTTGNSRSVQVRLLPGELLVLKPL
ncbi:MAG: hypothetical protein J7621_07475 [Niastella sp.]|nr:hypothetical protein [Niastella sp.]